MNFHLCKITVIQKCFNRELSDTYLKDPSTMKICTMVEENQEFLVKDPYTMPEKMCASAWADIRPYIIAMATGGTFDFMCDSQSALSMCSDPFRPVVFKIERV